jgi:hypothetical protein
MALKSTSATAGAAASVLVTPLGTSDSPTKVAIVPAADILIGGADDQTFTVTTAGITLDLIRGDVVYCKRAAGADVAVQVLIVGA